MPGHKKFKTKVLSKQIGSARLSFADDDHMKEYLKLTPGSVSVMGLMNDPEGHVKLLIDSDVLKDESFGCHPCINTSSLKIKTSDILEKFLPAVHPEPTIFLGKSKRRTGTWLLKKSCSCSSFSFILYPISFC